MTPSTQIELKRFGALVDLIYQGAIDLQIWQRVPEAVSEWLQASNCILFTPFHTAENGGFAVTHHLTPQIMALWASKYQAHDLWAKRSMERELIFTGNVVRDQDLVTEEEMLSSLWYREFLGTIGIGRLLSGVVFSGVDNHNFPVACSSFRPFAQPFSPQDSDKLRLVLPHLSRALGVMFRLRDAEFKVASSLAALDKLPSGVLLFELDGGVSFANNAAKEILGQEDGLRLRGRAGLADAADIVASDSQTQNRLDQTIRQTINPDILSTQHFSHALTVARPSGKTPLALHFSSLAPHNEFGLGHGAPCAIAFISDSAAPVKLNTDLLKATYQLTSAEIRTAEVIANGDSLEEIAASLDLSINTIKTQLRHIYEKTNTNSRAKLVKLLFALAA